MKLSVQKIANKKGTIYISGSKNASLPLLVCSLLTNEELIIDNVPKITDVLNLISLLEDVGVKVSWKKHRCILKRLYINPDLKKENVKKLRASYYLMGALVGLGEDFSSYYPGGCSFMDRPINYHIEAFTSIGYNIITTSEEIIFTNHLISPITNIIFKQKSVGATINTILATVKKQHITIINNPSLEPEVLQVISLLKKMGAYIEVKKEQIIIKAVERLSGAYFKVMPDRIEAGSYLLFALANRISLKLKNVEHFYLTNVLDVIKQMGGVTYIKKHKIFLKKSKIIKPINLIVDIYPKFPTDLQQIISVVLTQSYGTSTIKDNIYPNRVSQISQLKKANANVSYENDILTINPSILKASYFDALDLRCGFACILIASLSNEISIINQAENILRGYDNITKKMKKIGINLIFY